VCTACGRRAPCAGPPAWRTQGVPVTVSCGSAAVACVGELWLCTSNATSSLASFTRGEVLHLLGLGFRNRNATPSYAALTGAPQLGLLAHLQGLALVCACVCLRGCLLWPLCCPRVGVCTRELDASRPLLCCGNCKGLCTYSHTCNIHCILDSCGCSSSRCLCACGAHCVLEACRSTSHLQSANIG
jgi:hypothetical protein